MIIRVITIFIVLLIFLNYSFAQSPRPGILLRRTGNFILRTNPTKEQKKRLVPNPQDLRKYEQFLEQPHTGIFRLMPDIGCTENINVIKADAVCLSFIPESSYYSFREKEHTIELLSDIRLKNGVFISDGILSQSILVHLGEIALEEIAPASEGLAFLTEFSPSAQGVEAQNQYTQMMRGVKVGKYEYKKAVPMIENATYALRVVAYKGNVFRTFRGYWFDLIEGDKRIDLTIAFRVIRKEQDGAVTLLWKEIGRKDSPRLTFPKRRK
ncbi:MAG TPA: hypothetical protein VNB22_15940 [Pyrinomonadaceae bacterium]|jgi:hypothetical protein|nr:hypothetical protein [Pyrinomonadaceae bacterium]